MNNEEISRQAYARWEAEGRPDGQHERHWREAEEATRLNALPQTWSSDHAGGVYQRRKSRKANLQSQAVMAASQNRKIRRALYSCKEFGSHPPERDMSGGC